MSRICLPEEGASIRSVGNREELRFLKIKDIFE